MRVCVVGSVNNDLTFVVDRLPQPGATVLASSLVYAPGGKGANQAIAAARSGAQVEFVGAVGDDAAAAALISHLRANGVGTEAVSSIAGPSGTAIVVVDAAAENMIVVAPGANSHLTLGPENARLRLTESDVVLMQLEVPLATVLDAARLGRQSGATVMLNASPIPGEISPLAEMAQFLDVVVVNEEEAKRIAAAVPMAAGSAPGDHTGIPGRVLYRHGALIRRPGSRRGRGGHHGRWRRIRRGAGRQLGRWT